MNMRNFHLVLRALIGALAVAAYAQQPQRTVDCESLQNSDDPRCQPVTRMPATQDREPLSFPRIPVIRDPSLPASTQDRRERLETGEFPAAQYAPVPKEEPTEFQRFVEQSSGRRLPIFGQNLFRNVPSTFAPADRIAVTPEYTVGPGDQLLVRGWGQIDLNLSPVVDRAGAVYIPQVGEVHVAGLRFAQVQDYLKAAIGKVYRNFDLSVNMGQLRSMQVFVVGHARRPGAYTISALSTLVNAVFASGGPDSHGSMRAIRLTRMDKVAGEFDLYDLLLAGDKSRDVRLLSGDVIYIPPVGPQIAVTGSVNTPAIYEIKSNSTLGDALELAGGLTPVAARRRALIERIEDSSRRVVEVSLEAPDSATARLHNGDVVNVMAIIPRFEKTVTLRGNVVDPIRMPWRPGMRIRDLIPEREALLTRDYWRNRNRLTFTEPDQKLEQAGGRRMPDQARMTTEQEPGVDEDLPRDTTDRDYRSARYERYERNAPNPIGAARTGSRLGTPGSIGATRPESPSAKNRIERSPLEVNWSYAVIERQDPNDLRSSLVPFHLGKAVIDGDKSQNLALEPGDVVTVFSTADLRVPQALQTRYVRLEGEFAAAGVYSVRPGETLRQLVARAGGFTPQAYLFGSEFLRESSRLDQQQRLDDFVNSLERQAESAAANIRGSVISPEETAAATSQISSQRELIQKLREVRATGRIVLDLDPRVPGVEGLPDMQLEDADVFVVPSRPSFVNVVGSVYSGTSFVYQENKRLGQYLKQAGGPTRTADSRRTFLIRADGSVVSRKDRSGFFGDGFESAPLNPGDTIVVPEQINKTTFLKQLKDWSQVFAQFGLGAAAINVLR